MGADLKVTLPADEVAQKIFLGQVYPSGNVYLKAFNDELGEFPKPTWPPKLVFRGIATDDFTWRIQFATFKRVLGDKVVNGSSSTDYLPGIERMDSEHRPCTGITSYVQNSYFRYIGTDFYRAIFDYCESNEGIAQYVTEKGQTSFRVVAFDPSIVFENLNIVSGKEGRPLAPGEADEVERKKRSGASALNDCTTVPAYITEAVVLFKGSIADTTNEIRVSSYGDPGCMGLMRWTYLLDVLSDGHFQKRYELIQTEGPY